MQSYQIFKLAKQNNFKYEIVIYLIDEFKNNNVNNRNKKNGELSFPSDEHWNGNTYE